MYRTGYWLVLAIDHPGIGLAMQSAPSFPIASAISLAISFDIGCSNLQSVTSVPKNRIGESDSESPKQHPLDGHSLCLELIIGGVTPGKDGHRGA